MNRYKRAILETSDATLDWVCGEIRASLEGDSNDAEHDALAAIAALLGIEVAS